ncbi:MAG: hypothetical protein HYZ63_00010 [Candidatus Andersenbacteria bacterium]|nr:hypothetical protein [Candidatus Andersenbacteria bacterium]
MPKRLRPYLYLFLVLVMAPILCLLGLWLWFLSKPAPFDYAWAAQGLWPVACSTRGCVTTRDWSRQFRVAEKFALLTASPQQTLDESLTSAIRQHLLHHAFFKSPVTEADAKRYREQVLNVNKGEFLEENLGMGPEEYDRYVILPFLEQEALKAQNKVESVDELYAGLSHERLIVFLPWQYKWDKKAGKVLVR